MTTIVALHAHPDDEALLSGGWLAQRSAAGDRVVLVFATDGGSGLTSGSGAGRGPGLAPARRAEAEESARVLGVGRLVWLGHADSGMAASPAAGPGRFVDVPVEEAAHAVVAILDEEDAGVLTGYDVLGGYGHPDHLHVHRVGRAAQASAARRPLLLEATRDRTWLVRALRVLRPFAALLRGLTLPGNEVFTRREEVSFAVDVSGQLSVKRAALAAHASQTRGGVRTLALLLALPAPLGRRLLGTEWFVEVE